MKQAEEKEPKYCIGCGKILTEKDTEGCNHSQVKCRDCGKRLGLPLLRCISTGEKGCKGQKTFYGIGYPDPAFCEKVRCPLCDQIGQIVEVEDRYFPYSLSQLPK